MAKLNNRQRQAVENLALGTMTQGEAYLAAGYKSSKDRVRAHACKFFSRDDVKLYYAECRAKYAAEADLTPQRVMDELRAVALSNLEDYTMMADGSIATKPGSHPLALRALSSKKFKSRRRLSIVPGQPEQLITEECEGEIKLHNKVESLKLAAEIVGLTDAQQKTLGVRIDSIVVNLAAAPQREMRDVVAEPVLPGEQK